MLALRIGIVKAQKATKNPPLEPFSRAKLPIEPFKNRPLVYTQ
jgi:hypothetical protein